MLIIRRRLRRGHLLLWTVAMIGAESGLLALRIHHNLFLLQEDSIRHPNACAMGDRDGIDEGDSDADASDSAFADAFAATVAAANAGELESDVLRSAGVGTGAELVTASPVTASPSSWSEWLSSWIW
jgi:hypothetical protein